MPVFDNIFAGLSGPAVRPIALRMVWQAVGAVNIRWWAWAVLRPARMHWSSFMAGAAAVQVGAANFANPRAMETIADEMSALDGCPWGQDPGTRSGDAPAALHKVTIKLHLFS